MFSIRYHTTCTIDSWITHEGFQGGVARWKNVTAATSFADVLAGDGTRMFRDQGFLFIKLRIFISPETNTDPSLGAYERGGVKVWSTYHRQRYYINASCGSSTPDFMPVTDVTPTGYWV
jgi:hypothetical protein